MSEVEKKSIKIVQLYPRDMNIYGDNGNAQVLEKRLRWHGYSPEIISYNPGDVFPEEVDILLGGGGQDSGQVKIEEDLQKIAPLLKKIVDDNTPTLLICGMYQLFGTFFKTEKGEKIPGIGVLDIETHAGSERLVGNMVVNSQEFGEIIGYENHSGQTFLASTMEPLGIVEKGAGNNGRDASEGARYKNLIGTYAHGPLLPKNPAIAEFLIEQATIKKYGEFTPAVIDDSFAEQARKIAIDRPR